MSEQIKPSKTNPEIHKFISGRDDKNVITFNTWVGEETVNPEPFEAIEEKHITTGLSRPERRRLEKSMRKMLKKGKNKNVKLPTVTYTEFPKTREDTLILPEAQASIHKRSKRFPKNKGIYLGLCNTTSCGREFAVIHNTGNVHYYCLECGLKLNEHNSEFEKENGHPLCEYGGENKELQGKPLKEIWREVFQEYISCIEANHPLKPVSDLSKVYLDDYQQPPNADWDMTKIEEDMIQDIKKMYCNIGKIIH